MKRILALAVAVAVVAGGGVAWGQANGSSQSQKPAATKAKKQMPRSNAALWDGDCPYKESGTGNNTALDL